MIYLQLFISYLKIGFFGFGGGYAMLSLIQNEVVVQNAWMTNAEFTDIVAISQMTPGPIAINSATYVGYTVAGFRGSVVATVSVCLPALTLMILITKFFLILKDNRYVKGLIAGMRPVVIGMIGAAALLLMFPSSKEGASFIDGWSWALFIAAMIAAYRKVNPILLIVLSAAIGIIIYYVPAL
jgi:chromate transporter